MPRIARVLMACAVCMVVAPAIKAQFRDVQSLGPYPPSGNLRYDVHIDLQSAEVHRISIQGQPEWVVGGAEGRRLRFVVTTTDGRFHDVGIAPSGQYDVVPLGRRGTAVLPVLVREGNDSLRLLGAKDYEEVGESYPLRVGNPAGLLRISGDGRAAWVPVDGEERSIHGTALSDGIITISSDGVVAVPVIPSARYPHGILGNTMEPREFQLFREPLRYWQRIGAPVGSVYETLLAVWADTDGDGKDELLLTESNSQVGARFAVHDLSEGRRIVGAPNGRGFRWKHLIGAGPVGPEGGIEVIGVSTPHIGGVLEFYVDDGDSLELVHSRPGFSSHRIGSRNLAMAAIGDFNADGRADVLLPSQQRNSLHVIQRREQGSRELSVLELPAPISTNLFVVEGGRPAIAFGVADGTLVVITDRGE
jgi:hypothetical protein